MGLDNACNKCNWNNRHKQRISKLLSTDYMSSESSGEESGDDIAGYTKPVLKVKKLVWLRTKYRDAFHQIDRVYYQSHRVQETNSSSVFKELTVPVDSLHSHINLL